MALYSTGASGALSVNAAVTYLLLTGFWVNTYLREGALQSTIILK